MQRVGKLLDRLGRPAVFELKPAHPHPASMPHTVVAAVTQAGLARVRLVLPPAAVVGMAAVRVPGVVGVVVITVAAEAVVITVAAEAVATVVVGTQRPAAPLAERTAANL
jgi:hypothetical protein